MGLPGRRLERRDRPADAHYRARISWKVVVLPVAFLNAPLE